MSLVDKKYPNYSELNFWGIYNQYIVAETMAIERESGALTEIFNKVIIPSYNGNNPVVH